MSAQYSFVIHILTLCCATGRFLKPSVTLPSACFGWEQRCVEAAQLADVQGLGEYWNASDCAPGAHLSCESRAAAWSAPNILLAPVGSASNPPTLVLFLPGTGATPAEYETLLEAAARQGHHILGLSYSSYPFAVSQSNVWCTGQTSPSLCNEGLHESVLFGGGEGSIWEVPRNESVETRLISALATAGWSSMFQAGADSVDWTRVVVSGHSQGASHAAYLSVVRPVQAAVLFSGPQECPACAKSWVGRGDPMILRRGLYSLQEACGDRPANAEKQYCSSQFSHVLRDNLETMGCERGFLGNTSGYVVSDYVPLKFVGRPYHCSVAMEDYAPVGDVALWTSLFDLPQGHMPSTFVG